MKNSFIEITGFILSVQHYNHDVLFEIWDGKDQQHVTNLIISKFSIMTTLTGAELEVTDDLKGNYLTAFVNRRKPVLAIYPPRFYPELVAVRTNNQFGFVQIGHFDEHYESDELKLKLNITYETQIIDSFGNEKVKEDVKDSYAFVYYSRSTRSIPAQASVTKVVIYDDPFGEMQDKKSN